MQLGMIGLGRMGASMARRLMRAGHECVAYDVDARAVEALAKEGAVAAATVQALTARLRPPRAVWLMLPAGIVDAVLATLTGALQADDVVIDGGNSRYHDDIRRAADLKTRGLHHIDVGTSGGVWGGERGYCLMIVLHHADAGRRKAGVDAETTPLDHPEHYDYAFDLPEVVEVWRRGSVVSSWLLDLTANALAEQPDLASFAGHVSDSGEARWTIAAALDEAVPVPVLSAALYERFSSRGAAAFADRVLSAMRYQFGGHREQDATGPRPDPSSRRGSP